MNFFTESVTTIIDRDLNKLEEEIKLYPTEQSLWKISGDVKNSAGNLCLHLCGNLQHFIGAIIGNSGYIRNREHEFAARNIPREQLISEIQTTKVAVRSALTKLEPGSLDKEYSVQVFGYPMTTGHFLVHLAAHLGYHLGQVNYLRRLS